MRMKESLKVVDIFAGAGGFGEGFKQAGCDILACIEVDDWACDTLEANMPGTPVHRRDITTITDEELANYATGNVDVVIGGPPCQGFSFSGPKEKDPNDPRNSLFLEFVRCVSVWKPNVFVMENVPGLLNRKTAEGLRVVDVMRSEFEGLGYRVNTKLLRACDYGVPQIRQRLFVIGTLNSHNCDLFPTPTHCDESHRLNSDFQIIDNEGHVEQRKHSFLLPFVTLWEAISDFPRLEAGQGDEPSEYLIEPQNCYQLAMREGSYKLYNHTAMKHSKKMVERFRHMSFGQSGESVPAHLLPRRRLQHRSGKIYSQNNRRMHPDRVCHTLPASFYANFIHPFDDRNFTPREGARIQSFPDRYIFKGKPTVVSQKLLTREDRWADLHLCQYNQIGNAVPPLVSRAIAETLLQKWNFLGG